MTSRPWLAHYEPHVPHEALLPTTLLPDRLRENAQRYPHQVAIRFFGAALTYRELDAAVDRFAAGLQQRGLSRGDRVAIFLPNCPQTVIAYYGILRAGMVAVPCDPLYVARELEHQLNDSGAVAIVVLSGFYKILREARPQTRVQHVIVANIKDYFPLHLKVGFTLTREQREGHQVKLTGDAGAVRFRDFLADAPRTPQPVRLDPEGTACLLYTGGTTGVAKGAELSHRNLLANAYHCHVWFNTRIAGEVCLCPLPFSHGYGMSTNMNWSVWVAGTMVLIPNPRDLKFTLEQMDRYRATFLPGVPTLFIAIANYPEVGKYDLRSVRACVSGGAVLTRAVKERFESLTGGKVVEGYGLSECSPVTHVNPVDSGCRVGTIGLPWPGVDCKIVSLDDGQTELPAGQEGELCIRGTQVMKGYWNRPEETARVLVDGWLHTGDIATMDADGYFTIVSRKKDLIIAAGYKIFPREIEEVLHEHPKVKEAVAAGVPHPYRGETVKAYVLARDGETVTQEEIIAWCRERLAKFKVPTEIEFRRDFPRTAVGKVLRRKLLEEELAKTAALAQPPVDALRATTPVN